MAGGVRPSILACLGITALIATVFLRLVDLKPQVDETFFFSKQDPQVRADNQIARIFPESSEVIVAVAGDIRSPAYAERIGRLSDALAAVPGVSAVQSLSRGPKSADDALKSPLWGRLLISRNQRSSYIYLTVSPSSGTRPDGSARPGSPARASGETMARRLEAVQHQFDRPGFRVTISGVPYVTELIAQNLARDLRVFTLAAACLFGVMVFLIFRSLWILLGTLAACLDSSAATLIATHLLRIPVGPLTANLSTIVFVMTLSPIVFLTFNWKRISQEAPGNEAAQNGQKRRAGPGRQAERTAVRQAIRRTVEPSLWSSVCMLLGFISLLFVPSTPMRHLGVAGAIGAGLAFVSAYTVYPWFLAPASTRRVSASRRNRLTQRLDGFFSQRHGAAVVGLSVFTLIAAYGLLRLNTDPDLPSYFKAGGDIHTGLATVDRAGGSSPLKLVVEDRERAPLNTKDAYKRLWTLQDSLERDPAVGSVVSLPMVLAEAKRTPFSFILTTERLIKILDEPKHGEVSRRVISPDRVRTLFVLRMRETGRQEERRAIIARLRHTVEKAGFRTVLVGGAYSLLDQMARLVTSSIISGVLLLLGIFVAMGFAFSRSFQVAGAMLASLAIIPVIIRGVIGYLGMPLDFITASAANLDLGMGVDAMIYLCLAARDQGRRGNAGGTSGGWAAWSQACSHLWRPIGTSLLVICSGFGIFLLSNFPPTQRFGLFVILGSATAATSALLMFPWLASAGRGVR